MASLSLRNVSKSFGSLEVVHALSLDVADREFVVLVGPSGCGKSTLLRMIAGLEDPSSGAIAIDGQIVNHMQPKDRDIAMVFQDYALYPHMTVFDNMAFGLLYRGTPKSEIRRRVEEAARILNIAEYLHRRPRQLSGGQRQRAAMGRAMVRDPKIFLFDEPLSNLDAKLRVQMRTEIKKLHQRVQTTIVYVTHDQVEAMTLADRIVVMRSGRVEQIGGPDEVYSKPASTFVAGFIGAPTMNLLPARIERQSERLMIVLAPGVACPIPSDRIDAYVPWEGKAVILGLRPENLSWADGAAAEPTLEASALVVEPLGSDTLIFFELGGREVVARLPPQPARRAGDRLRLRPDLACMHLFDPHTERRI
jgi:ABC-type sugar transport system ATPase subunit